MLMLLHYLNFQCKLQFNRLIFSEYIQYKGQRTIFAWRHSRNNFQITFPFTPTFTVMSSNSHRKNFGKDKLWIFVGSSICASATPSPSVAATVPLTENINPIEEIPRSSIFKRSH